MHSYPLRDIPYPLETLRQITQGTNGAPYVEGVVPLTLGQMINNDLEGTLDLLSEALVGSDLLLDINYTLVGRDGDTLHLLVGGDVSDVLACAESSTADLAGA